MPGTFARARSVLLSFGLLATTPGMAAEPGYAD
jgi:hypothetical protein